MIGNDWRDSEPWWPDEPEPPPDAPNVVLIVLDDVGFAQLGCYGSDIDTPVIDGLAAGGVRLTNFHTTALCSPTRACLLTGRNHHRSGMGRVADLAMGFPGYWGQIPIENGFLSEILAPAGLRHLRGGQVAPDPRGARPTWATSRRTWPLGRGFDRWYGFHGGETHQFAPALYHDNHAVAPPGSFEDGYHLSEDLADRAIEFLGDLRAVDDQRPSSSTSPPGPATRPTSRRPHGSSATGAASTRAGTPGASATFARQLAMGLVPEGTELSPRPPWVPAWDDLDPADQAVAARFMECFAAFLSHTDAQIGRVLDFIDERGERDDTLVVLVSDNGASSEGGPRGSINDARLTNLDPAGAARAASCASTRSAAPSTHNNYPWGWTMAGNTPFRRWKREVHEGGVADPCIVSWPARLRAVAGTIRHQFAHAVDVLPTVLELAGLALPGGDRTCAQSPSTAPASPTCWAPTASASPSVTTPSTSRCSGRAPSTTGAGRR